MKTLYGIGNPLVDSIHYVGDGAISQLGFISGSMNLIAADQQDAIRGLAEPALRTAGGSCANTLRGFAWLAHITGRDSGRAAKPRVRAVYAGAVGDDDDGDSMAAILEEQGVVSRLVRKNEPTGTSVILVEPDGERTMFTQLGACREFGLTDIDEKELVAADMLHITGYVWDSPVEQEAALRALQLASEAGLQISLDVADPFVADRYRNQLLDVISRYRCLVFCNEDEIRSLLQMPDVPLSEVFTAANAYSDFWLVKTGAEGCHVLQKGASIHVPTTAVPVCDTTGAGDAFAAGFLFAQAIGMTAVDSARLANMLAGCIVGMEGTVYSDNPSTMMDRLKAAAAGQFAE